MKRDKNKVGQGRSWSEPQFAAFFASVEFLLNKAVAKGTTFDLADDLLFFLEPEYARESNKNTFYILSVRKLLAKPQSDEAIDFLTAPRPPGSIRIAVEVRGRGAFAHFPMTRHGAASNMVVCYDEE